MRPITTFLRQWPAAQSTRHEVSSGISVDFRMFVLGPLTLQKRRNSRHPGTSRSGQEQTHALQQSGRAFASHARGRRFDLYTAHYSPVMCGLVRFDFDSGPLAILKRPLRAFMPHGIVGNPTGFTLAHSHVHYHCLEGQWQAASHAFTLGAAITHTDSELIRVHGIE